MNSDKKILQFPKSIRQIFKEIDDDRIIKGKYSMDKGKFAEFCNALQNVSKFGELKGKIIKIICDDPRIAYQSHCLLVHFETSEFEDEEVAIFSDIVHNFNSMDILTEENGDITVLLLMENMYIPDD